MTRKSTRKWALGVVLVGILLGLGFVGWIMPRPDLDLLATHYPHIQYDETTGRSKLTLRQEPPGSWVSVQEVSQVAIAAIQISEDWAFFQHKGIDVREFVNSVKRNIREMRYARGASTITQQVVRNVFLGREKTVRRKVREIVYSILLERKISKKKILEMYLNIAEWGEGIYGIRRASRFYFNKWPANLSAKEGAFLAMLLPNPKKYSLSFREDELTPYASKTIDSIIDKLFQAGVLTAEERDSGKTEVVFDEPVRPFFEKEMLE